MDPFRGRQVIVDCWFRQDHETWLRGVLPEGNVDFCGTLAELKLNIELNFWPSSLGHALFRAMPFAIMACPVVMCASACVPAFVVAWVECKSSQRAFPDHLVLFVICTWMEFSLYLFSCLMPSVIGNRKGYLD